MEAYVNGRISDFRKAAAVDGGGYECGAVRGIPDEGQRDPSDPAAEAGGMRS